jgi:hypothetical protein
VVVAALAVVFGVARGDSSYLNRMVLSAACPVPLTPAIDPYDGGLYRRLTHNKKEEDACELRLLERDM